MGGACVTVLLVAAGVRFGRSRAPWPGAAAAAVLRCWPVFLWSIGLADSQDVRLQGRGGAAEPVVGRRGCEGAGRRFAVDQTAGPQDVLVRRCSAAGKRADQHGSSSGGAGAARVP